MTSMDTMLVPLKFYVRDALRSLRWDLEAPADAARLWHHVPRVGERINLTDEKEVTEPNGADHPNHSLMTVPRTITGKVYEVIWTDDGVAVLLTA